MFKNLFVPIDGGSLSEKAVTQSVALAKQLGAAITGFIVEPDAPLPTPGVQMTQYEKQTEAHLERTDTHARRLLSIFEEKAAAAGVPFHGLHLNTGGVGDAIVAEAERAGCDMIVMVTHGRSALGELIFGSHTKKVLARSSLPVLVLH